MQLRDAIRQEIKRLEGELEMHKHAVKHFERAEQPAIEVQLRAIETRLNELAVTLILKRLILNVRDAFSSAQPSFQF